MDSYSSQLFGYNSERSHFWASANQYLKDYTEIEKEPSAIAEVTINPPLKSLKTTIARMYLTGCSVGGSLFDCGVSGKALTASTLTVAVYANQQNSTLKDLFVSFSYILFSPSEAKFSSYGGMVDKEKFVGVDS